jgi:serine protease Do
MNKIFAGWFRRRWLASAGGAVLLLGSLFGVSQLTKAENSSKSAPVQLQSAQDTTVVRDGKFLTSFAPLVKKVAPSVVKVSVTVQPKTTAGQNLQTPDFWRFFGIPGDEQGSGRQQFRAPKQHGIGSGVIVSKDGYILTNNHVVDNAQTIKVETNENREFTGKVVGRDPKTDVAVIKIDASDLPYLPLADSDKIEVGDVVLAIGNPFGIGQTVTSGIISAKGRASLGLDEEDFIQTDAAINPGNSGGALVDTEGRLIGINTAILSESGGNQGIGFAVPANLARWVMTSLVKNGQVERGFLGVNIQDLTPELAKQFNVKETHGALVSAVTPDSPADKAGLKSGDVIVEFNGRPVTDSRHLKLQVTETVPGSSVPVKVMRDGVTKTMSLTVKQLPGESMAKGPSNTGNSTGDTLHGVGVTDLDSSTRSELQVPAQVQGAVVSEVQPDSAAYEAGLRQGDVIMEINHKPVKNAEQAVAATTKPADRVTLLRVWSHGGSRYVVVDESQAG